MTPANLTDGESHPAAWTQALSGSAAEGVIAAVGEHWSTAAVFGTKAEGDQSFVVPGHAAVLTGFTRCQQADTISLCRSHHLLRKSEDQPLQVRVSVQGRGGLEGGVENVHPSKVMDSLRRRQSERLPLVEEL